MADETDAKDFTMDSNSSERRCDESKCLSTGLMPGDGGGATADMINNPLLFNCYAQGPGTLYPYLCAEDYVGVRISNEDAATSTHPGLHYYTCCPSDESESENDTDKVSPVRECEDPQEAEAAVSKDWNPSTTCRADSLSFRYGRKTTQVPGFPKAYMCCNFYMNSTPVDLSGEDLTDASPMTQISITPSIILGPSTRTSPSIAVVIDEGEVVENQSMVEAIEPIDDDMKKNPEWITKDDDPRIEEDPNNDESSCQSFPCHSCVVKNKFLDIQTMNCYNDFYQYPQVVNMTGNTATYQCCSVTQGDTINSNFLLTSPAYHATVWTQFTLALIASLMASLLIVSIGRSLYVTNKNSTTSTTESRVRDPDYSIYNIYLIFLAIPDLSYNLFMLGIVTENFFNGWIPGNDALITISATTNQYMNAIIANEVLVLLRRTKDCQRYAPPLFKKVWIQFVAVTAYATILGILWLYLLHSFNSTSFGRATVAIPAKGYSMPIFYTLVVILPAVYLMWVCFEIWHKQLLPKDEVTINENEILPGPSMDVGRTEDSQPSLKFNRFSKRIWNVFRKSFSNRSINNTTGIAMNSNRNSSHDGTAPSLSAAANGRLNVMVIYFMRIILVFFFLWLPGMIMYYAGYQTDRNASGLLHNLGQILFSLQAIVSNGMAFTKPDVKKSILELWKDVAKFCCCLLEQKDGGNDTASTGKFSEKWPEADIEVPIREEPPEIPLEDSNPSVSSVVTVYPKIVDIGGIQVSQLTTHTISSFLSDGNSDSESDTENNEHLEFAIQGPKISRNPNIFMPESSSHSHDDKDSKSERKKSSRKSLQKQASGSSSGSKKRRKSLRVDRSNSNSPAPDIRPPEPPVGPPRRRNNSRKGSKSPIEQSRKRRNSSSHKSGASDSPVGQSRKSIGSFDTHRNKSPAGSPKQRRGSSSPKQRRGSGSHKQRRGSVNHKQRRGSGSHMSRRNSGSHMPRRNSISHMPRRSSGSHVPVGGNSPVAELRKKLNANDHHVDKSHVARPAHRRGSGSHLCKLNASNSPVAQLRKQFDGNNSHASKTPAARPIRRKSNGNHAPAGDSPIAQLKKVFIDINDQVSKANQPLPPPRRKLSGTSNMSKTPGPPKRKLSGSNKSYVSRSPGNSGKKLGGSGKNVWEMPFGESQNRNSGSMSNHASKSPGHLNQKNDNDISFGQLDKVFNGSGESLTQLGSRRSGSEKKVDETPFGKKLMRNVSGSGHMGLLEKRISSSDSSVSRKGKKKGVSNSKSLSFDGSVTDN